MNIFTVVGYDHQQGSACIEQIAAKTARGAMREFARERAFAEDTVIVAVFPGAHEDAAPSTLFCASLAELGGQNG